MIWPSVTRNIRNAVLFSIGALVVLYALLMFIGEADAVFGASASFAGNAWIIVLSLSLVNYFIRFLRWHMIIRDLGHRIPVLRHLVIYIAGFSFTATPGKAGELFRSAMLADDDVPTYDSVATFVFEKLLDLTAISILALAIVSISYRSSIFVVAFMCVLAFSLYLVANPRLRRWAYTQVAKWKPHLLETKRDYVDVFSRFFNRMVTSKTLLIGMALGTMAWSAEAIGLYVILDELGIDASISVAIGIYAIALLVGALSFIPGGLGSTEATMVAYLMISGANMQQAGAATLICRLATLWFAIALGFLCLSIIVGHKIYRGHKNATA